jgi:hypothetical protein
VTPSGAHAPTVSQANHVGTRLDVGLCVRTASRTPSPTRPRPT